MTLSETRRLLKEHGIQLTKSLGQNFLHDAHQLNRIIAAADLRSTDTVLEIGAGLGPLTERLLQNAGEVLAIEKDARLVRVLEDRFNVRHASAPPPEPEPQTMGKTPVFHLLQADALQFLQKETRDWAGWKIVSNLPYSVASPILVELCQGPRSPKAIVATLQLEVVQRLISEPGRKEYGALTLLVRLDFEPVRWFKIPSDCFFPRPEVDSACIVFARRPQMLLPEALRPVYVRIVKRAFSQRRKMMLKLLKQDWPPEALAAAYTHVGLSPQVRAEAVASEQFAELTRQLGRHGFR